MTQKWQWTKSHNNDKWLTNDKLITMTKLHSNQNDKYDTVITMTKWHSNQNY